MIRGKGSVKDAKHLTGRTYASNEEPLHALVSAPNDEVLKKAVAMVTTIVKTAIENPEGEADLRRLQVMELAKMNGTLREGAFSGMAWLREEGQTIVNTTVCTSCGGRGHIAADCKIQRPGTTHNMKKSGKEAQDSKQFMDAEYQALMSELGETTSAPQMLARPQIGAGSSQMATHSVGGVDVQAAIEDKPQPGAPNADYGYANQGFGNNLGAAPKAIMGPGLDENGRPLKPKLKKEDMVNTNMLGSGMWDNKEMGMTMDYTVGFDDKTQYEEVDKAMIMGDAPKKRKKTYGQADPDGQLAIKAGPGDKVFKGAAQYNQTGFNSSVNARARTAAYGHVKDDRFDRGDSAAASSGTGYSGQGYVDYDPSKDPTAQANARYTNGRMNAETYGFGATALGKRPQQSAFAHGYDLPAKKTNTGSGYMPTVKEVGGRSTKSIGNVTYRGFHNNLGVQKPGVPDPNATSRPVKHGLDYLNENPNAGKNDRIRPSYHLYERTKNNTGFIGPSMGPMGPPGAQPSGKTSKGHNHNNYKKPTAEQAMKRHFNNEF